MFVRAKKRDDKTYLLIVESKRVGKRIEQITLASLGGLAARFGRSAELLRLFCQPPPASPLTLVPPG